MFDTYKDKTLVQMKIHANQQAAEIEKLRGALTKIASASHSADHIWSSACDACQWREIAAKSLQQQF